MSKKPREQPKGSVISIEVRDLKPRRKITAGTAHVRYRMFSLVDRTT
jgi:hypothetical protein